MFFIALRAYEFLEIMSVNKIILLVFLIFSNTIIIAQNDTITLKEIIVSTNRISLPAFKSSRTINLITNEEIRSATASNVTDLLQQVAGIDVRRRGVDGTQSDLYIRGGSFDQTLVLIDGIKMDDAQTGHHTMNAMLALENIERIEILKGPASRVFGQNAFAGAINIITKRNISKQLKAGISYGSFENLKWSLGLRETFKNGDVQFHLQKQKSDGYRFNTDFDNTSLFFKTNLNNYQILANFNGRKFGANGFYASPNFIDQYEEIQTSLIALSSNYSLKNLVIEPRIYWRRNQICICF